MKIIVPNMNAILKCCLARRMINFFFQKLPGHMFLLVKLDIITISVTYIAFVTAVRKVTNDSIILME